MSLTDLTGVPFPAAGTVVLDAAGREWELTPLTDEQVRVARDVNAPVYTLSGPRGALPPWEDQS